MAEQVQSIKITITSIWLSLETEKAKQSLPDDLTYGFH